MHDVLQFRRKIWSLCQPWDAIRKRHGLVAGRAEQPANFQRPYQPLIRLPLGPALGHSSQALTPPRQATGASGSLGGRSQVVAGDSGVCFHLPDPVRPEKAEVDVEGQAPQSSAAWGQQRAAESEQRQQRPIRTEKAPPATPPPQTVFGSCCGKCH